MGRENLARMADTGTLWIPCMLRAGNALAAACGGGSVCCRFSLGYAAPGAGDPQGKKYWENQLEGQRKQLRLARELGVPLALGTGAGSPGILHGEAMVEEMKWFIRAGFSLEGTIHCASAAGARFFGLHTGQHLTPGVPATFLVTRGTIKQLPRKLSYLEAIYIEGSPCSRYSKTPTGGT